MDENGTIIKSPDMELMREEIYSISVDDQTTRETIKSVYGVRSRYLHHGHTSSELKLISDFMMQVWIFFIQLLANIDRFKSQGEFVNAIDDHKLA